MEAVKKSNFEAISLRDHVNFLAAIFCFWFAVYIYAPVFGVYLQSIGFSYSMIGIVLGSYGVTQILLRFPLGILSDFLRGTRRHLLVLGFLMALLSSLILAFFNSFAMVLIARLLAGVTASMWVMATVLYSYYFSAEQSSKAMGALQFVTVVTQFFSMGISGYLVHLFGWHIPFWLGAAASILGVCFAWNIRDSSEREEKAFLEGMLRCIKKTIKIPQLNLLTFLSLAAHAILFITIFGFSPIAATKVGSSEESFTLLICAFFIPHALASLSLTFYTLSGRVIKVMLALCFCLTAFFLLLVPLANSLLSLSTVHAGIGLTLGFVFPILLGEVVKISPSELKMSAMGFFQSFYALGIFLGPLGAGIVAEKLGLSEVFFFTALLSLAASISAFGLFLKRYK